MEYKLSKNASITFSETRAKVFTYRGVCKGDKFEQKEHFQTEKAASVIWRKDTPAAFYV